MLWQRDDLYWLTNKFYEKDDYFKVKSKDLNTTEYDSFVICKTLIKEAEE